MEDSRDRSRNGAGPAGGSAWRGSWDRPMHLDESSLDPLTAARMTDHNVRGGDQAPAWSTRMDTHDRPAEAGSWHDDTIDR
jgi:hypothetical protein